MELRVYRPLLAKYPQKAKVVGKRFFLGIFKRPEKTESQFKAISEH
ncbi:hypothetical protein [Lacticaseibacillus rhamnosus]|nr:hypothetical protein [Lacticaseibacillus rhamnosus]